MTNFILRENDNEILLNQDDLPIKIGTDLNSEIVDEALNSEDYEILRILGEAGNYGDMLELDSKWAYNIIKQIGNYSTIFENNIGTNTVLGLNRGLNNLWINNGILYAPPFR